MRPTNAFILASAAGLMAACGSAVGDADGLAMQTWTVDSVATTRIGGHDERPEYLLERTMGATRLSDGRIAIADGGATNVRIYDSDGVHLATHGREGQGPGEFQYIMQLQRGAGDHLLTLSLRPGISWVDPNEGVVEQLSLDVRSFSVPCRLSESNQHLLPTGNLLLLFDETGNPGCGQPLEGVRRTTALVTLVDRDTGAMDSVTVLPATERNGPQYRVFGHMLTLGIGADRFYLGDTAADSILVYDLHGQLVSSLPVPFTPQRVPPEAMSEPVRRFTNPQTGEVRVGEPYAYPEALPPFGRLVAGSGNTLWVMAYPTNLTEPLNSWRVEKIWAAFLQPGGSDWRVLDVTGRAIAEVHLPERFILLEVGDDYVLGIEKDEFDVETVVVFPLRKPTET